MRAKFVPSLTLIPALFLGVVLFQGGCSKSDDDQPKSPVADTTIVSLTGNDVQRDGTLSAQGLNEIKKYSDKPALTISFLRVHITDAALAQLAQFKNIRRVEAIDSHLSDAAIAKLKAANPQVVVAK